MDEGGDPLVSSTPANGSGVQKSSHSPRDTVDEDARVAEARTRCRKIQESLSGGYPIRKVAIPSYHIADDVVVYEVDVSNKKLRWNLWLRFDSFYLLHEMMKELVEELIGSKSSLGDQQKILLPPFPEKRLKLLVDHFDEEFIEQRRCLLENYCRKILKNPSLNYAEVFISFLTPAEDEDSQGVLGQKAAQARSRAAAQAASAAQRRAPVPSGSDSDDEDVKAKPPDSDDSDEEAAANRKSGAGKAKRDEPLYVTAEDEITSVSIPSSQILKNDHTIYQVHCCNCNKRESFSEWTVLKRFAEIHEFDSSLRVAIGKDHGDEVGKLPKLPPRYLPVITDHLDDTFIEKRRLLLQLYLRRLIRYPVFRRNQLVLDFLGVYTH